MITLDELIKQVNNYGVIILVAFVYYYFVSMRKEIKDIKNNDFVKSVKNKEVEKIEITLDELKNIEERCLKNGLNFRSEIEKKFHEIPTAAQDANEVKKTPPSLMINFFGTTASIFIIVLFIITFYFAGKFILNYLLT